MKTTFEELKAELLLKAKNKNACESGYSQAEKCETEKELVQVIVDNFGWVWDNKIITIEDLNKFNSDLLQSVGIFINKVCYSLIKNYLQLMLQLGTNKTDLRN